MFPRLHALSGASALVLTALLASQPARSQESAPAASAGPPALVVEADAGSEDPDDTVAEEEGVVEEVVVTGTRFAGRTATESPVPIDTISGEELRRNGYTQLNDLLRVEVPSFTVPRPAAAGVVDFYTAPSLRGLSPGQLLVLVNGKRRHPTGDLSNHNQVGRGDVAYDLNAIPAAAIGRIEVLRDGAAAQYGADAIAGVINIVLDRSVGLDAELTLGVTDQGDGETAATSLGYGARLGENGSVRATVDFRTTEGTDRSLPDTRQQYFGAGGTRLPSALFGSGVGLTPSNGALDSREATVDRGGFRLGEPKSEQISAFVNAALPLGAAELYAFGGVSRLEGESIGFVRRAGQDETVRAIHPDGFAPIVDTRLDNYSAAAGLRGEARGFGYDLSTVLGGSRIDLTQRNSNNASLGLASPTESYRGGIRFDQWTTNLDLTREVEVGLGDPLNVAVGLEYREEDYEIVAGDLASYANGGQPILDGPNRGRPAPIGFQTTSGTRPEEARTEARNSKAAYLELEQTFGPLLLSAAARYEDFSDFGDTTAYKLAGRLELSDALALRGSVNTGFRAPNLAQSFFSTTSNSVVNGQLTSLRLLPVDDPAARILGATDLRPETSLNYSVGAVFREGGLSATIDLYQIKVEDRIALSSTFQDARVTNVLAAAGFPGIAAAAYLTNAVDTTSQGVDLTVRYTRNTDLGRFTATLAANYNKSEFDRIAPTPAPLAALGIRTPLFDLTQQIRFTDSLPRDKEVIDLVWEKGRATLNLSATRYGPVRAVAFSSLTPAQIAVLTPGYDVELRPTDPAGANSQVIQEFGAEVVADALGLYRLIDRVELSAGVTNLFDAYPDRNIASTVESTAAGVNGSDNAGIFHYNSISPLGFNGRAYTVRLAYRF